MDFVDRGAVVLSIHDLNDAGLRSRGRVGLGQNIRDHFITLGSQRLQPVLVQTFGYIYIYIYIERERERDLFVLFIVVIVLYNFS